MISFVLALKVCFLVSSFSTKNCSSFVIGGNSQQRNYGAQVLSMTTSTTTNIDESRTCCIENSRQAAGLPRIYRCASTDPLASVVDRPQDEWSDAEQTLLQETGLVLDLRSPSERNDEQAQQWTSRAPDPFVIQVVEPTTHVIPSNNTHRRRVLQIDVLSPTRFMEYASENWFTSSQKAMANLYWVFDAGKVHEMRIDELNRRGLTGLNEIILETGKQEICIALQEVTLYLEQNEGNVAVHCVQGKDRTGMLILLCQSIMSMSDDEIISDYHLSDAMRGSSAAASDVAYKPRRKGKLDRRVFSGAPKEACVGALEFIRRQYGSVDGYLDALGFDESWRQRFRAAVQQQEVLVTPVQSKL